MADNNKTGRDRGDGAARKQNDYADFTATDPLAGWYSLGKTSRINRQQKRTWRRRSGGALTPEVAGWLVLLAVTAALLVGMAL